MIRWRYPASVAFALLLPFSAGLVGCGKSSAPTGQNVAAKVRVARVQKAPVSPYVSMVGTATPIETSIVASEASGVVRSYPFREGAFVHKGEALAELQDEALAIELQRARALWRQQQQKYAELKSGYRPEEIAQAEARMRAAEAAIHLAESHQARLQDLESRNSRAITEQELDQARFETEKARQDFIEAKADYEMKAAGYREEVVAAAKAAMDAAEHEVRRLEDEIRKHTVRAPFDGFLVVEHTDVGQWVEVGGPVATLARLDEVEVRVQVEESAIHLIQPGDVVDVRFDALPNETFSGEVTAVVPRADWQQGSRSFPVVVRVKNKILDGQPKIKEGMIARLTFRGPAFEALLVHKDAIVRSTGRPTVFVVDNDGVVRAVVVKEGQSYGELVVVEGDLREGDLTVTEGVERLRPYDRVAILNKSAGTQTQHVADTAGDAKNDNGTTRPVQAEPISSNPSAPGGG